MRFEAADAVDAGDGIADGDASFFFQNGMLVFFPLSEDELDSGCVELEGMGGMGGGASVCFGFWRCELPESRPKNSDRPPVFVRRRVGGGIPDIQKGVCAVRREKERKMRRSERQLRD